jgi:hypothetical protein
VLTDQHGPIEIYIEDVVPSAPLNLDRITVQTPNTDIVVKYVDAAELRDRGFDEPRAVIFVADIGSHAFSVEPFFT